MTEEERKRLEELREWKKQQAEKDAKDAKDLEELKRLEEEFNRRNTVKPEEEPVAEQKVETKEKSNKLKKRFYDILGYVISIAIIIGIGTVISCIKREYRESRNYTRELNRKLSSLDNSSKGLPNTIENVVKKNNNTRPCPICFDGIKKSKDGCTFCNGEGKVQYVEYPDNIRYAGRIVDGKREGKGMLVFVDGANYIGDFKNNHYHGKGLYTWANGGTYNGEWKDGHKNGVGRETYASGDIFEGYYENGKKNGEGVYYWADGKRYNGTWRNDKMNGKGTYTYADGTTKTGFWQDDKFVSESTSNSSSSKGSSSSGQTFTYKTWSEIMAESNAMFSGNASTTSSTSKNIAEGRFDFHEAERHGFNSLPLTDSDDSDTHSHSESSHIHTRKRCPNYRETFPTSSYCVAGTYHCYVCALDDFIPAPPTEHQCPNCRKWHYSNTHHTCVCEACDGHGYIEL